MDIIKLLNLWLKYTKFDENQTVFKVFSNDWEFNSKNKKLIKFFDEFDNSGAIPLLYAKFLFNELIQTHTITLYDLFKNNIENFSELKELYSQFYSKEFEDFEKTTIKSFEIILSKLNTKKMIGNLNANDLLTCCDDVLENILDLKFDVYKTSGIIQPFNNFSNKILLFETISQCLLTLENSLDGVYLCYISKENSPDGYFGFYIKNNGNLFSVNERIDEKYIGQHKNMRSHRYTNGKAYDLFPYEIFEFLGEDYKGYATQHKIDDTKLTFDNLQTSSLMNIIVMLFILNKKYTNKILKNEDIVYVNSLFEVNVKPLLELNKNELIPFANNSSLIKFHNDFKVAFSKDEFLDGSLCNAFNFSSGKKYDECGSFKNINQAMVEKFGKDFDFDTTLKNVFETDRTKLLLNSDTNNNVIKKDDEPFNNEFVGNKRQVELQAFYLLRKKLAQHILDKQMESLKNFGGIEKLKEWYDELLMKNVNKIIQNCIDVYKNPESGKINVWCGIGNQHEVHFNWISYSNTDDKDTYLWSTLNSVCQNINHIKYPYVYGDKINSKDLFNQKECYHWFKFHPINIKQLREYFNVEFPDFCEGYWLPNHDFKPYTGNSILDVVDPVDRINSVLCYRNSNRFNFSFSIGFSKSSFNKLLKNRK